MKAIDFVIAALLLFLLAIESGCILGPIAASQLSKDQLQALKEYNDSADIYFCAQVEGGSRSGNLVAIAVPKGASVEVTFSQDCHGTLKTQTK